MNNRCDFADITGKRFCGLPHGHTGAHKTTPTGVWVVYSYDTGPYAISIHDDELMAFRNAEKEGYGRVAFWEFNTGFTDAIKKHEAPKPKVEAYKQQDDTPIYFNE